MMRANNNQYSTLYLYLISHAVPWLWYCRSPIICGRYVTTYDTDRHWSQASTFYAFQITLRTTLTLWYSNILIFQDLRSVRYFKMVYAEQSNSRIGVVNVSCFAFLARKPLSILYRFNVNANKITCIFYSNHAISKSFILRHQIFRRK